MSSLEHDAKTKIVKRVINFFIGYRKYLKCHQVYIRLHSFPVALHQERIFLALALMSRYKKLQLSQKLAGPLRILGDNRAEQAIILGRAMRLGAMVSGTSSVNLKKCKLFIKDGVLYLNLKKSGKDLGAGIVERRLKALAEGINLKYSLLIS